MVSLVYSMVTFEVNPTTVDFTARGAKVCTKLTNKPFKKINGVLRVFYGDLRGSSDLS